MNRAQAEVLVSRQDIIDDYHRLYYNEANKGLTWGGTSYFGYKIWKAPSDLHLYQEVIFHLRPSLIIETGTAFGGSALYFAHLFDQIGSGRVLTIDLKPIERNYPHHPRITYRGGHSSTDAANLFDVSGEASRAAPNGPVMVILDSDHSEAHVTAELAAYARYVTENSYLVVEDTNVGPNDLVYPEHGPGPGDAVRRWLPQHPEFVRDERLPASQLWSMHTWLKRRRT